MDRIERVRRLLDGADDLEKDGAIVITREDARALRDELAEREPCCPAIHITRYEVRDREHRTVSDFFGYSVRIEARLDAHGLAFEGTLIAQAQTLAEADALRDSIAATCDLEQQPQLERGVGEIDE